jgi:peptidoglycan/LPS O-acetylase OafA/YrhL
MLKDRTIKNRFQLDSKNNTKFSIGNYYPALDGLRGLAILMIIVHHNFDFLPLSETGWISLDLFFVLSGFLITGILLKKKNSPHFLRNFYARRVLRIFPIYYLSVFIFLFILPKIINYPFSLHYFIANQYWFWLEIQNWLFILRPGGNNNFLNHFWSLALEEQFYLICPWIILFIRKTQNLISFLLSMLLLILVLRLAVWALQFENVSYVNIFAFTRIDGLCVGSLLAIFTHQGNFKLTKLNKILGILFLLLVFVVMPLFKIFYHFKLPYLACCLFPAIALFWGFVIWSSISIESLTFRIFSNRILIFFGRISYGLYIFHWPINRLFKLRFETETGHQYYFATMFLPAVISTAIAIIVAVISFYTYERYFLGLKRYFT